MLAQIDRSSMVGGEIDHRRCSLLYIRVIAAQIAHRKIRLHLALLVDDHQQPTLMSVYFLHLQPVVKLFFLAPIAQEDVERFLG